MPQHDGREEVTEDGRPYIPYEIDYEPTVATDTPREKMVEKLIRSGDLSISQAQDILNLTDDRMSFERVAGYVAGEFGVPPKAIEEALKGTKYEINASQIEETKRSFLRTAGDIGGNISRFLSPEEGNSPYSTPDGESIFQSSGWVADVEGNFRDARVSADETRENLETARNDALDTIASLLESGYLISEKAAELRGLVRSQNSKDRAKVSDELRAMVTEFDGMPLENETAIWGAIEGLNRTSRHNKGDAIQGPTVPGEETTTAPGQTPEEIGDEIAAAAAVETQGWGEYTRFNDLLNAAGYGAPQPTIADSMKSETTEFLIDWGEGKEIEYNFDAAIGKNAILDRATGTVMTNQMYNLIRTDDALRKRYQELGKPTAAVEELLGSGRFNIRERTRNGIGTGEYFKPTQGLGMGSIPAEDLNIPSVAPSKPWETDAYNWTAGSGVGQWSGMAAYSRQAKVQYMVSSGMATDEQAADYLNPFSLSGGQQWERVLGISRELQVGPYTAMTSIGNEIDRIRKLVNRPSGGRGRSGGGRGPTFSVPASLREIPDYKTLATRAKGIFNQELGRDMEDWELSALADELKDKYVQRNNQRIKIYKAAWNDSVAGGSTKVDFSEVEEPLEGFEFDINEKYADELDRYDRVEDRANNRRLMMDSIAVGERMI